MVEKNKTLHGLGFVVNVMTPYRLHLMKRIYQELPVSNLHIFLLRGKTDFSWEFNLPSNLLITRLGREKDWVRQAPWKSFRRDWKNADIISSQISSNNINALIINGWDNITALRLIFGSCPKNVKIFIRGDSNSKNQSLLPRYLLKLKNIFLKSLLQRANAVLYMGRLGREYFNALAVPDFKLFEVPYEPDYSFFQNVEEAKVARYRNEFNLDKEKRYFLYVGRLVPQKNIDLLLDAFIGVSEKAPSWDLIIVGSGPMEAQLRNCIPTNLKNRVHWIGFLQWKELRYMYHLSDVFVLPSKHEPWGVVVNEAMAAGLPVIASDVVGAASELIEDMKSGIIFPVNNKKALISALEKVADEQTFINMKAEVINSLANWRKRGDPVKGLRNALKENGFQV